MSGQSLFLLVLLAMGLVLVLYPRLGRRLTLIILGRPGREAVGRRALARQPDHITLLPSSRTPSEPARRILDTLGKSGFKPAGAFTVKEMAMLPVELMVDPAASATAAVYEHPAAGVWFDIYSHYADGSSLTFSTARLGGGLDARPDHKVERLPGLDAAALLTRFLAARPSGELRPVTAAGAPGAFAAAYAESVAWRKARGLSAEEVERVGTE
jgi:hypothetical protein